MRSSGSPVTRSMFDTGLPEFQRAPDVRYYARLFHHDKKHILGISDSIHLNPIIDASRENTAM